MSKAKILPIPEGVLAQHIAILGKTRSGKSSKARVLVEYLLEHDLPVCIIDPKGDWWGLKLAASGRAAGFSLVIFGGDHADIPITDKAGTAVAEIVATGNRSCLIDLGGWTVSARTRFFIDFAETLFKLTKGNRHLVIDEVHNFCPKGKLFGDASPMMLHWANRLATEGQGKGIRLIAASQRPQKVHNDFLTSCETLIACRTNHPADRVAFKEWMEGCADPKVGKDVLDTLASMQRAEAWTWSPEIDYGPARITWPKFATYDSFKPQDQDAAPLTGWAEVDLEEVKNRLASFVEEAQKNDPKQLLAKIAQLQREKANAERNASTLLDRLVKEEKRVRELEKANNGIENRQPKQPAVDQAAISTLQKILQLTTKALGRDCVFDKTELNGSEISSPLGEKQKPQQISALKTERTKSVRTSTNTSTGITGPEQKVINAIAWYMVAKVPEPYTKVQVAAVAGYSPNSGGFNNLLGKLRTAGLIEYPTPGAIRLTDKGWTFTDPMKAPGSSTDLHDMLKAKLSAPQWRVLQQVIDSYPDAVTKSALGQSAGYSATSGGFNNLVGSLRSLGLIDYPRPGYVKAEDILFIH